MWKQLLFSFCFDVFSPYVLSDMVKMAANEPEQRSLLQKNNAKACWSRPLLIHCQSESRERWVCFPLCLFSMAHKRPV